MQTNVVIENFIGENAIFHYQNEITFLTQINPNDERIHMLQELIDAVNKKTSKLVNNKELYNNHVTFLRDILFKKKWHQLKMEHKINRLQLYCSTHNIPEDQREAYEKYQEQIGFTAKDIEYDNKNGIIISINPNIKIV